MRTLTVLMAFLWTQAVPPSQAAKAVVSGHVRLSDGSPLSGVRVAAVPVDAGNVTVLMTLGQTDPTGAFRLEGVPPGRYYLTAGLVDAPVYLPGVRTQADARIVSITEGASIGDLDFVLSRPVTLRVSGRLSGLPPDAPSGLLNAMLFPTERSAARPAPGGLLTTPIAGDGKFEFTNVTSGTYELRISSGTSIGISPEATRILVDDRDIVNAPLPQTALMVGRLILEGGASLTSIPTNNAGGPGITASSVVGIGARKLGECCAPTVLARTDGWFAAALRADNDASEFLIYVSQLPFGFHVRSIMSGTTDVFRTPLKIAKGTAVPIEVTLTSVRPAPERGGVKVSGRLTGAPGPLSGTIQLRGKTLDLQSALSVVDVQNIGLVPIAPDGSFVFEKVPPGSYEFQARLLPSAFLMRRIDVPAYDVDRVEVQLTDPEITMLRAPGTRVSFNPNSLPQIPIPSDPNLSRSVRPDINPGSLTVSQSGSGPMYIEGSYSYFLVISAGSIVEEKRLAGSSTSFSLPPGDYELRAYVRPCDGNCGNLDPPVDECRALFTLTPGEALTVNKTISGHSCTLKFSPAR